MSAVVPGMYASPNIGRSDRGYPLIAVDGAFINRIPHIPGDVASIAMSYTRATKMPKTFTDLAARRDSVWRKSGSSSSARQIGSTPSPVTRLPSSSPGVRILGAKGLDMQIRSSSLG